MVRVKQRGENAAAAQWKRNAIGVVGGVMTRALPAAPSPAPPRRCPPRSAAFYCTRSQSDSFAAMCSSERPGRARNRTRGRVRAATATTTRVVNGTRDQRPPVNPAHPAHAAAARRSSAHASTAKHDRVRGRAPRSRGNRCARHGEQQRTTTSREGSS